MVKRDSGAFRAFQIGAAALVVGALTACCTACGSANKSTATSSTGPTATTQNQGHSTTSSTTASQQANTATTKPQVFKPIGTANQPYVVRMKAIGKSFEAAVRGLYPLATGTSGSPTRTAAVAKLETARQTVANVQENLDQLAPPVQVKALHMKLSKAVGQVGTELDEMIAALQQNDLSTYISVARLTGLAVVNVTTKLMKKDGYDIVAG